MPSTDCGTDLVSLMSVLKVVEGCLMKLSRLFYFTLLIGAALGSLKSALAQTPGIEVMKREKDFSRCYGIVTGKQPAISHPLLISVRAGTLTAKEACLRLFDLTNLNSNGLASGIVNPSTSYDSDDARATLENFQNFHKSWFPSNNYENALNVGFDQSRHYDIHDVDSAANDLSRILFANQNYRDLVTGVRTVVSIRDGLATRNFQNSAYDCGSGTIFTGMGFEIVGLASGSGEPCASPGARPWRLAVNHSQALANGTNPPLTQLQLPQIDSNPLEAGVIRGFRALSSAEESKSMNYVYSYPVTDIKINYNRSFGGGAMGSHAYFMLNSGLGFNSSGFPRQDGGVRVARRFSQSVLRDFMCRSLPVVSSSEISEFVRPSSNIAFRKQASCTACHATIDGMSGVVRNYFITGNNNDGAALGVAAEPSREQNEGLYSGSANNARLRVTDSSLAMTPESIPFSTDSDANWHKRQAKGWFVFKDYQSNLIKEEILGLEALGQKLQSLDDYYMCAASRYLKFFTGKEVGVLSSPSASTQERNDHAAVVNLGLRLKASQSLRSLISDILDSDVYKDGNK